MLQVFAVGARILCWLTTEYAVIDKMGDVVDGAGRVKGNTDVLWRLSTLQQANKRADGQCNNVAEELPEVFLL